MRVISIDLGSNTLRVLKFDCTTQKRLAEFEKIVRTAEDLNSSGKISKEAIQRVVEAINEAKKKIDFRDSKILAVTTEAIRRAKNQKEALQKIKEKSGIDFRVIDGKEEAFLTLKAVNSRLKMLGLNGDFVLVDIGGGSTEITFKFEQNILTKSFPIGIVTTAQKYKSIKELKSGLKEDMKIIKEFIGQAPKKPKIFVATAGTPTTIASIKLGLNYLSYDPEKINGTTLSIKDLDDTLELLLKLDEKQKAKLVGVGREDLIVAGVLIFRELFELLGFDEAIVVDDGLREGVALSGCK